MKRPELSQKDKSIQTKVTSLFGKWNEEKVQIFVLKCREEKLKAVRKINIQENQAGEVQIPEKFTQVQ